MDGYISYNANPKRSRVGDCVIRAVAKATGKSWDEVYKDLSAEGYAMADMPNANNVWGAYLRKLGFRREVIPDTCPDCYTVADFAREHPTGTYILATGGHAIAVDSGKYYDTWDSGDETPAFYWYKENGGQ